MSRVEKAIAIIVCIASVLCLMSVTSLQSEGRVASAERYLTYHEEINTELPSFNIEKFSNPEPPVADTPLWIDANTPIHLCSTATERLTSSRGVFSGPSGKESYYNLPMGGVVKIMRNLGYSELEYPYWVCEGCGCKMLGGYIMVASNFDIRPRGTIIETSLGLAICADTGAFAKGNTTQLDVAVDW